MVGQLCDNSGYKETIGGVWDEAASFFMYGPIDRDQANSSFALINAPRAKFDAAALALSLCPH
jgi:hypothetical protein